MPTYNKRPIANCCFGAHYFARQSSWAPPLVWHSCWRLSARRWNQRKVPEPVGESTRGIRFFEFPLSLLPLRWFYSVLFGSLCGSCAGMGPHSSLVNVNANANANEVYFAQVYRHFQINQFHKQPNRKPHTNFACAKVTVLVLRNGLRQVKRYLRNGLSLSLFLSLLPI